MWALYNIFFLKKSVNLVVKSNQIDFDLDIVVLLRTGFFLFLICFILMLLVFDYDHSFNKEVDFFL